MATQGEDFFGDVILDAPKAIPPDDIERHLKMMSEDNVLNEIREHGVFLYKYNMLVDGQPIPTKLKATMVEEAGEEKIILGVMSDVEN